MALLVPCFQVELEFGVLVLVKGGNPKDLEKNHWSKDEINSKLNLHVKSGLGITPGPQFKAQGEHSHYCVNSGTAVRILV